jgi:hypothetical protein
VLPVTLELELRDNVDVVLELADSVEDTDVLWVCDTSVLPVTLELELRDNVDVVLALTDSVEDTAVL